MAETVKKTTDFFRIAVSGPTVDGRIIDPKHIDEMAASYKPETYTARINCEHIRGFSPEKPFNAYGSVIELKAEDVELDVAGKKEKKRALYGRLEVTGEAVALNQLDQKVFTSVEIQPSFADSGKAYLVGLAMTDSPASLGTEVLKFNTRGGAFLVSPLEETALKFTAAAADATSADPTGVFASIKGFFDKMSASPAPAAPAAPAAPVQAPAAPANDNLQAFAQAIAGSLETFATKVAGDVAAVRQELTDMKGKLDTIEKPGERRNFSLGSNGAAIKTDC